MQSVLYVEVDRRSSGISIPMHQILRSSPQSIETEVGKIFLDVFSEYTKIKGIIRCEDYRNSDPANSGFRNNIQSRTKSTFFIGTPLSMGKLNHPEETEYEAKLSINIMERVSKVTGNPIDLKPNVCNIRIDLNQGNRIKTFLDSFKGSKLIIREGQRSPFDIIPLFSIFPILTDRLSVCTNSVITESSDKNPKELSEVLLYSLQIARELESKTKKLKIEKTDAEPTDIQEEARYITRH